MVTGQVMGKYRASTGQVFQEIQKLVKVMVGEMKRSEIQSLLEIRHRDYFSEQFLNPAIKAGFIEMTIPEKPQSSKQKYRLTDKGEKLRHQLLKEK